MVRGVVLLHIPFLNLYDPNGLSDPFGPVDLKPAYECLETMMIPDLGLLLYSIIGHYGLHSYGRL